jgi:hypothetical protein
VDIVGEYFLARVKLFHELSHLLSFHGMGADLLTRTLRVQCAVMPVAYDPIEPPLEIHVYVRRPALCAYIPGQPWFILCREVDDSNLWELSFLQTPESVQVA